MIKRKAFADAKMHATPSTNDARSHAIFRLLAAHNTVSSLLSVLWIVILGQTISCFGPLAWSLWPLIGQQLCHYNSGQKYFHLAFFPFFARTRSNAGLSHASVCSVGSAYNYHHVSQSACGSTET